MYAVCGGRTVIYTFDCFAVAWGSVLKQASVVKINSDKTEQKMYLVVCHCNYSQTSLA